MLTHIIHSVLQQNRANRSRSILALVVMMTAAGLAQNNLTVQPGATFTGSGTIRMKGSIITSGVADTIEIAGKVVLTNAGAQTIGTDGTPAILFDSLTTEGSGTKTVSAPVIVRDSLTVSSGTTLDYASDTLRVEGSAGIGGALSGDAASLFEYAGDDGTPQIVAPATYGGSLVLTGSSPKDIGGVISADTLLHTGGSLSISGDLTVGGHAEIDTLYDVGAGNSMSLGNAASTISRLHGMTSGGNLLVGSGRLTITTLAANAGSISGGIGGITVTGAAVNSGTIAGGDGLVEFLSALTHSGGTISAGAGDLVFNGQVDLNGTASITSSSSGDSIAFNDNLVFGSATSTLTLSGSGVAAVSQGSTLLATDNFVLASGSRVTFNGAAQSIPAASFGHLTLMNAGAKVFPADTVSIAGDFSVVSGATFDALSNAGTVAFTGAASQSIAGADYHHLVLTNAGVKTFAADTTRIAGDLDVSGAGGADLLSNSSTVEFNGTSGQSVGSATYHIVIFSSAGVKTLATSATLQTAAYVRSGSTFRVGAAGTLNLAGDVENEGTFENLGTINLIP